MRRYLIILGMCLVLAACGASAVAHQSRNYAQPGVAPVSRGSAFARAQASWKQTAAAAAADVSRYLLQAARDLQTAGGNASPAVVRALRELASIPETSTTRTQQAEARADVAMLDRFFNTPGMIPNG